MKLNSRSWSVVIMGRVLLFAVFVFVFAVGAFAGHDHFFQYANVPGKGNYEFGYNRGNQHHFTSRFEKAHGWTFKTKVRWGDKNGWGESYWDYNHADKGKKGEHEHKGWGQEHKGWGKEHKGWGQEHKGWGKEHKGWGHEHKGWGHGGGGGQGAFSDNVEQAVEADVQQSQVSPMRIQQRNSGGNDAVMQLDRVKDTITQPQQSYPQQDYPQQAFPQQAFPQQAFPQQAYPQQAYPQQRNYNRYYPKNQ